MRNVARSRRGFIQFAASGAILFASARPGIAAAPREAFVSDPLTGTALFGFDPVAYAIDGEARRGREEMAARWAGYLWSFSSESNRAEFLKFPAVYAPRYGGYDPVAVAGAVPRPGHPQVFAVTGRRLYLFAEAATRAAFLAAPAEVIARADAGWPLVLDALPD